MNIITLDFETFFDSDYTLKKMTTEAYVRDERFETLGVGIRWGNGELAWYTDNLESVQDVFDTIDWPNTAVLAHHAAFDGLILAHHYGHRPALWLDTLSMARLQLGNHLSVALGALASHYGLAAKQIDYSTATGFGGRRSVNLTPDLWRMLGDGCLHDVALTWDIFRKLAVGFPKEEYRLIDMTIRMFTEPRIEGDVALFERVRDQEFMRKGEAMAELGVSKADLMSNEKFATILRELGVDVEYKDGKNGPLPALAKTDDFMKGLQDHDNERISLLAGCRLEAKSTIDETRAGRFAAMAQRGALPVYLSYCAAHTTRWGGGDRVNLQNLRRNGELRTGLRAPRGSLFAVADKSQIECRLLNFVAGQTDVVDNFRAKRDPYVGVASAFYGREITKADKKERQVGKVLELACGYGMGWKRFQGKLKENHIDLDDGEAMAGVQAYRATHPWVVDLWRQADGWLEWLASDGGVVIPKLLTIGEGKIILPNGCPMHYVLEQRRDDEGRLQWFRKTRRGWVKIWGGHLVENVIQALGRVDMGQSMLRIEKRLGRPHGLPVMTTHDDAAWLLPRSEAQAMMDDVILPEMSRSPDWLPELPLDAEGGIGETYGSAKD